MAELTFRTAGESHGPGIYTLVDGLPQGLELNTEFIDAELRRPRSGRPTSTLRSGFDESMAVR